MGIPGAHTVVLSAGQSAKDRDFGAYRYASLDAESGVSGRVFDDRNRNGAQDPGENGLANRVVWLDQNKNDVLDEGERVATTDENGDYAFENLLAGEYRVVLDADETQNLQTFPSGRLWDASAENLIVDGAFDGEYGDASDAVSQTFATIPGTRYVVQYSVAGNGTSNVAQYAITAGVERCDGVFDASTTDAAWGVRSWSFVATSTETTLTFAGANEASSAALIEGVRVVPAASTPGGGWTVVLGASHWAQRCDFGVFDLTAPRPTLDVVSVPSGAATEGVAYRYDVEAVDSANEKLTYSLLVAPEGMAIHPELGVVVWTPSANDLGKRQVVVKVENESGLTASQTFEILVSPANHAPILITESVPTPAFVDLRYEVVVEAVDPDGDVLTYSFDAERGGTAPVGMTIDAESGKIAWTPTLEQLGEHTFTVVVADGRGAKATATATIRVVEQPKKEEKFETNDEGATDKNSAPILLTQEISNPAFVDSLYEVVLEATDPDGDALTYSFDAERGGTAPVGMTIDAESGKIAWTPTLEQLGEHTFTVVVADGRGAYATATATLSVVEYEQNVAPEFKTEPSNYALAGLEYLYRPQIVDANGDAFTLTLREAPEGTTFDPETNLLRWTPTLDDVGTTVRVALEAKDVRGASATQVWEIAVCADCVNLAPTIVSQPSNLVQPGETYVYDVVAVDPENDALVYSLTTGPDGMAIDALTGKVRWTPTGNDLGVSSVSIIVEDASGNRCSQQFEILTFMINLPPQIISSAPSGVYAGDAYFYAIEVYEPEEDPVSFRLDEAPEGMTIDSQTGLVCWATTAADVGEYSFGVVLSDGFNEYGVRYEIVVLEKPNISVGDAENNPPQILSTPEQYGEVGARYEYAVVATDPDGDALSYSLEAAPKNATIDPLTGVLTWTPNASQVGVSDFIVVVADARGAATVQEFNFLTRSENAAPIFESTPDEFVYARNLYSYDVSVVDPEGDAVFYAVEEGPEGATIDANGRFRWTADATLGERRITISATDVRGNKTTQSWTLNVEAQGPKVQIVADEPFYPVAENFSFYVALESRVGIRKTVVTLVSENGDAVNAISIRGSSTILANAPHDGSYVIRVEATDLDGFTTVETKTILCAGVNPSAPIAYVKSPNVESEEVLIQKTTPIVGDVYDPDGDLEYFTVSIGAYGLDPKSEKGWRLLYRQDKDANSDEPLELRDHTLYVFDPSLYADGWYTMRVQGYDARGNTGGTTIDFFVLHDSDWANFSFSFTDLQAQTSSIPFVMTRTYDTSLCAEDGEFGYGWSHTFRDLKIQTNVKSPNAALGDYEPFAYGGSKVTITLPDGSRDVFEFKPSVEGLGLAYQYIGAYAPNFESTTGSGGTLTLDGASYAQNQLNYLRVLDDGSCYVWGQTGLAYNPFNPTINRGFTYTTKEGLKYHIDAQTMKVDTISDPFGHKLNVAGNEIFDENGDSVVTFERDGRNRITAIKLADGRSTRYTYDALGNLSTFTGLDGQTITYRYYDAVKGREHYIRSILDAEGNEALTLQYDDFGRVVGLADVTGAGVEVSYDSDHFVRTTVDQLGNATVEELDEYGNVLKTVTPEGGKILATYDENGNRLSETTVVYDADGNVFAELTTKSTYDSRGNVASATDVYGNVTSYTYDAYGQVTSTTTNGITVSTRYDSKTGAPISGVDEYGRVTTYGVDSSGNLTSMKNENGDVLTNLAYDGSDNLTNAVIDGFRTIYFAYDSRGNQTDAWFFDGETKVCDKTYYDSADRVVGTARYVGTTLIYSTETIYNALGQVVSETDRVGLKTEYLYDARGYVVQTRRQVVDASGVPVWFVERSVYDAKGQAIAQTDSVREGTDDAILGTVLTYDKDGRVVRTARVAEMVVEIDEDGFSTLTSVGAEIYAESTVYNNAGWKLEEIDRYGLSTRYSYDKFGNVVETIQERVDENGNVQNVVSRTVYDNFGRVWLETSAALESETLVAGTRTEYDVHGNRLSVENLTNVLLQDVVELSGTANYRDALVSGTLTSLTSSTYVNGAQTESVDALGGRSTFEYDSTGRLTSQTSATGVVNSYVYNDFGLVVEQTATTATASATQKYEYDYQDRLIKTTYDDGTTFESVYDAGNLIAEKNRGGQVKRYEYDSANRLTAVEIASGTDVEARYEYEYDAAGNRTVIRDALGRETRYVYDAAGNVLSRTLPLGTAQGADSQSFTEYFEYDAFGRTARAVSFEGVVTRYEYDAYGRLARVEYYASEADESNGKLDCSYSYKTDVYGRTIATTKASASGAILREEATTYSSSGSVVTVSGAEGVIRYEYDVYGRLTRTSSDRGDDVSYGYDEFGRLTTVCDAAQNDLTTSYSYDDRGNLAKIVVSSGITTTYRYDASNRLVETTNFVDANANGVWDAASESRISQFEYGYDALGQKTSATERFGDDDSQTIRTTWTYDGQNRLTQEVFEHYDDELDQTLAWTYDLVGNRLTQTRDLGNDGTVDERTSYRYDANDRLIQEIFDGDADGVFERTTDYDWLATQQVGATVTENGTVVKQTTYAYNAQGLTSEITIVENGASTRVRYEYDSAGARVATTTEIDADGDGTFEKATRTEFLNDANNPTGYSQVLRKTETDLATGEETVTSYTIGLDQIVQTVVAPDGTETTSVFTYDGRGSTRALVDLLGTVAETYAYDAYGNAIGFDPANAATDYLHNGEPFDAKTGRVYLRARDYDPSTGRFTTLDPFYGETADPQSLHKYAFAENDPIQNIDPTGMTTGSQAEIQQVSAIQGSIANMEMSVIKLPQMFIQLLQNPFIFKARSLCEVAYKVNNIILKQLVRTTNPGMKGLELVKYQARQVDMLLRNLQRSIDDIAQAIVKGGKFDVKLPGYNPYQGLGTSFGRTKVVRATKVNNLDDFMTYLNNLDDALEYFWRYWNF